MKEQKGLRMEGCGNMEGIVVNGREGQPKESGHEKPFGGLMTHKPTSDHNNCRDSRMGVKQKKGE